MSRSMMSKWIICLSKNFDENWSYKQKVNKADGTSNRDNYCRCVFNINIQLLFGFFPKQKFAYFLYWVF